MDFQAKTRINRLLTKLVLGSVIAFGSSLVVYVPLLFYFAWSNYDIPEGFNTIGTLAFLGEYLFFFLGAIIFFLKAFYFSHPNPLPSS